MSRNVKRKKLNRVTKRKYTKRKYTKRKYTKRKYMKRKYTKRKYMKRKYKGATMRGGHPTLSDKARALFFGKRPVTELPELEQPELEQPELELPELEIQGMRASSRPVPQDPLREDMRSSSHRRNRRIADRSRRNRRVRTGWADWMQNITLDCTYGWDPFHMMDIRVVVKPGEIATTSTKSGQTVDTYYYETIFYGLILWADGVGYWKKRIHVRWEEMVVLSGMLYDTVIPSHEYRTETGLDYMTEANYLKINVSDTTLPQRIEKLQHFWDTLFQVSSDNIPAPYDIKGIPAWYQLPYLRQSKLLASPPMEKLFCTIGENRAGPNGDLHPLLLRGQEPIDDPVDLRKWMVQTVMLNNPGPGYPNRRNIEDVDFLLDWYPTSEEGAVMWMGERAADLWDVDSAQVLHHPAASRRRLMREREAKYGRLPPEEPA